ncbi:uncharacterized protein N7477_008986 [Penicillium maclennaniae]|uniref:uncharacterized protein n=1 Tax=Penicillium maclennaniae TaxID=1343394 RepID=UPI0025423440|nr:uncharacterized protein N7477_008986 [Penicillium maclennaniae]KAJ5666538.1 hypothetical protein N7477_008986 [Penicillium maclennaniae]
MLLQILLGFEPLEGIYTGENLALALYIVINRYRIKDQILAITTDNTLNNKIIFNKVQRTYPDISIVHIPCMAYVIQLSLNKLLYRIKVKLKNDTVNIVWTDKLQKASTQRGQKGDIANTLDRVFKLYNKLFKYLEALISQLKKKKAYRSSVSTTQRPISLRLVIYMRIALSSHQRISYSTSNARNTRDIFSIPATGAGVERLFNLARDICYYRRGRLNLTTIQDLMIFSCLTQFEIEDK